jgi:hypothetical protein
MQVRVPLLAGLLVIGTSALALAQSPMPTAPAMGSTMGHVTVKLYPQNKSGETATAVLTQTGPDVVVVVTTMGGPDLAQPIHIHKGTCANLNPAPTYPLTTVQDGKSTTTLKGLSLMSLENGDFAINIHHSTSDVPTYYACGDIAKMKM